MSLLALLITAIALLAWSVDAQCIDSLNTISDIELYEISPFNPDNKPREYVLCPNKDYATGFLAAGDIVGGMQPLFVRSNATVKCGTDGKRENNCTIKTGSLGLFINVYSEDEDGLILDNVVLQGLTFQGLREKTFYVEGYGGKINVIDCAFLDSTNIGNVAAIGVIPSSLKRRRMAGDGRSRYSSAFSAPFTIPNSIDHRQLQIGSGYPVLDLTFTNCLFSGNNGPKDPNEDPLGYHLVVSIFPWQKTTFISCRFRDNNFGDVSAKPLSRALIANEGGGDLVLTDNCFQNNTVVLASVIQYSMDFPAVSSGNFVAVGSGLTCDYLAWYTTFDADGAVIGAPNCTVAESNVCSLDTKVSTDAASDTPTASPAAASNATTGAPVAKSSATTAPAFVTIAPASKSNATIDPAPSTTIAPATQSPTSAPASSVAKTIAPVIKSPSTIAPVSKSTTSVPAVEASFAPAPKNSTNPVHVNASACISDLDEIFDAQYDTTGNPIPTDQAQVFILCPNTEYKMGFLSGDEIIGGFLPLFLRSNMTIKCGVDGKSSNNCNMTTGTIAFFSVYGFFGQDELSIDNAVLSGITFSGSIREQYFVIGGLGGSIDVIDCRFYDGNVYDLVTLYSLIEDLQSASGRSFDTLEKDTPLLNPGKFLGVAIKKVINRPLPSAAMAKNRRLQQFDDRFFIVPLQVTFTDCLFEDNQIVTPLPGEGDRELFMIALVEGFETVKFKNTMFRNNDWVGVPAAISPLTGLVGTLTGGHIEFETCCFIGNKVIGPGYAVTAMWPSPANATAVVSVNTYAPKNKGQQCEFAWYGDAVNTPSYLLGNATCVVGGRNDVCAIVPSTPAPLSASGSTFAPTTSNSASSNNIVPMTSSPLNTTTANANISSTFAPMVGNGTISLVSSNPTSFSPAIPAPSTSSPATVPTTASPIVFSSPNACTIGMTIADRNRDDFISQESEYVIFVNRLSLNAFVGLAFTELPLILRRNYESLFLGGNETGIRVMGARPGQRQTGEQISHLMEVCMLSQAAVDQTLNPQTTMAPTAYPNVTASVTLAPTMTQNTTTNGVAVAPATPATYPPITLPSVTGTLLPTISSSSSLSGTMTSLVATTLIFLML